MTYDIVEKKPEYRIDLETAIAEKHIIGFVWCSEKRLIIRVDELLYGILVPKSLESDNYFGVTKETLKEIVEYIRDDGDYEIVKSFTTYEEAIGWYLED
jgi:hypothetical protein